MSFWGDLGNALGLVGSTGASAVNLAYDIALTPLGDTDKADIADSWKSFTGKGTRILGGINEAPVLGDIMQAQYAAYSQGSKFATAGVRTMSDSGLSFWDVPTAVSTGGGSLGLKMGGNALGKLAGGEDPAGVLPHAPEGGLDRFIPGTDAWAKNMGVASKVSPGQAIWMSSLRQQGVVDDISPETNKKLEDEIGPLWNFTTGATDAVAAWYADPFVLGGKAAAAGIRKGRVQAPRSQADLVKLAQESNDHRLWVESGGLEGRKTAFGQFVEDTTKLDAQQLMNDSRIQGSSRPDMLAGLLGGSSDYRINELVIRAGMNDDAARLALKDADIGRWDSIETAANGLTQEQLSVLQKATDEDLVKVLDDGSLEINPDWALLEGLDAAKLDDLSKIYDDAVNSDPWMAKLVDYVNNPTPVMGNMGWKSPWLQAQSTRRTVARADRRVNPPVGSGWSTQEFIKHPFGRTVRVLSWTGDQTPAGWVNLRGASANDAALEVQAALSKVKVWKGAEGAQKRAFWINQYIDAPTAADRAGVITAMERSALKDMGAKYLPDLDEAARNTMIDELHGQHHRLRSTATEHLGSRGFVVEDGVLVKSPLLESQLGQVLPVADFGLYDDLLRRHNSAFRANAGKLKDWAKDAYDVLMAVWRPMVLLRLGYTQRNVGESSLRAAAYLQGSFNVDHWAVSAGRAAGNTVDRFERLAVGTGHRVMNLPGVGVEKRMRRTLGELRGQKQSFLDELDNIDADELVVHSQVPRGPEPAFMSPDDYYRTVEPTRLTGSDIEFAVASPSGSLVNKGERRAFIDEQAGAAVKPEVIMQGRVKAVTRLAGEKRREGYQLGYLDEVGEPVLVKNIKDIPDHVLQQTAIFGEKAQGGLLMWPKHQKIVADAVKRGERVSPEEFARYQRSLKDQVNPADVTEMRFSAEALKQRAEIQARLDQLDEHIGEVTNRLNWWDAKRRYKGQKGGPPSNKAKRGGRESLDIEGDTFSGAFQGVAGENALIWSSGAPRTAQELAGPGSYMNRRIDAAESWVKVNPGDKQYFDSLSRVLNQQFRNSGVFRRIVAGESLDSLERWARTTTEGKQWVRSFGLADDTIREKIYDIARAAERYAPSERVWAALRNGDTVTAKQLRNELDGMDLQPIHGPKTIEMLGGQNPIATQWNRFTRAGFKYLGNIPEDVAARHPFYRSIYENELKAQAKLLKEQTGRQAFTRGEKAGLEKAAHARALSELKKTLYTIERYSNGAQMLRWFAPFFASWANSLRVWTRLGINNPAIAAQGMLIYSSPERAGLSVKEDGTKGKVGDTDTYIPLHLPNLGAKDSFYNQVAQALSRSAIPKKSANIVFQGEPWWNPGMGPTVQVPASQLVKSHPEFDQAMKMLGILPFGASRSPLSVDTMLPPWVKKAYYLARGEDSVEYSNSMAAFMQYEMGRYNRGEREDKPDWDEIKSRANMFWIVRMGANLILPAAPRFESPSKFYVDEYRRLQQEDPGTANEKFLEQYPEHYEVMTSLSKNVAGVQASMSAYKNFKAYPDLVAEVNELDPSLVSLVTNGPADYQFDPAVYTWQFGQRIAPGSSDTLRTTQSPQEVMKQAEINYGWTQYIKFNDKILAIMEQRGLTSLNQTEAEDLAALKRQFIETLGNEHPDWYYAYQERDAGKAAKTVSALDSIVSDPKFMADHAGDGKWESVAAYLDARDKVRMVLEMRRQAGGSSTLEAQSNADVAAIWSGITSYLVNGNTDFADLFARYLENDNLGMVPGGDSS